MTTDINIATRFIFFTLVPHFLFLYAFALGCCWPHYEFLLSLPGGLGAAAPPQQTQKSGRRGQAPVSGWHPLCVPEPGRGADKDGPPAFSKDTAQEATHPTFHSVLLAPEWASSLFCIFSGVLSETGRGCVRCG